MGIEKTYLNTIKAIYMTNTLPASHSTGKIYKYFIKIRSKTVMSAFSYFL